MTFTCLKSREAFRSRFICLPLVTFVKEQTLSQELTYGHSSSARMTKSVQYILYPFGYIIFYFAETYPNQLLFLTGPFLSVNTRKGNLLNFFFLKSCLIHHKKTQISQKIYNTEVLRIGVRRFGATTESLESRTLKNLEQNIKSFLTERKLYSTVTHSFHRLTDI